MLKYINYVLQIFFIRIYRTVNVDIYNFEKTITTTGFGVMYWIIPFSGWTSKFKFLGSSIEKRQLLTVKP